MGKEKQSVKVSIIIPVYNTGKYLAGCLESVLQQSFQAIEVIAVDDGSQDDSFQILEAYRKQDPRLRIFRNVANRGVSYTLNRAIAEATTPLIARMDSDDLMVRDRIEKQYAFFQAHPEWVVLGGQVKYINEQGEIIGRSCFPLTDSHIRASFFYFQPVADPTVMFNLNPMMKTQFNFREDLPVAEGLDLFFRLYAYGRFANLPDVLVLFRQREGSLTQDPKRVFGFISQVRLAATARYGIQAPWTAGVVNRLQKVLTTLLPFPVLVRCHDLLKKVWVGKR